MTISRLLPVLIALLIGACASQPENDYQSIETSQVEQDNPRAMYERTAELFARPENLGLEFYSPTYYSSATRALKDAERSLNNPRDKQPSVAQATIAARKLLEKAQFTRAAVERNLKDFVKHRNLLVELEASKWQPEDWKDLQKEMKELVLLIEDDRIKKALKLEPSVRKSMYELEINTLLVSSLNQARKTLDRAEKAEAENYSPYYFNQAQALIADTEIYIRGNYRDRRGIAYRAQKADTEALHAYKTALDSKRLVEFDESDTEDYFIALKQKLFALSNEITETPIIPATIDELIELLVSNAKLAASQVPEQETDFNIDDTQSDDDESIEVLEVLDSLYLDDSPGDTPWSESSIDDDEAQNSFDDYSSEGSVEQAFDEVEFVE